MEEAFDYQDYSHSLYCKRPLIPNGWSKARIADRQVTVADMKINQNFVDSLFSSEKKENAEEEQKIDTSGLVENINGDILLDSVIDDILETLPHVGKETADHYRKNLLYGNIVVENDEFHHLSKTIYF